MKEVCGFLNSQGVFYKTKEEVEESEKRIQIREIEIQMNNVMLEIEEYLFPKNERINYYGEKNYIFEIIAKKIFKNSDTFISIINKKHLLADTLDEIYKKNEKNYLPWWLKLKWWK